METLATCTRCGRYQQCLDAAITRLSEHSTVSKLKDMELDVLKDYRPQNRK